MRKIYIGLMYLGVMNASLLSFPCVHVFGDSHAHFCFSNNGQPKHTFCTNSGKEFSFSINWLGPKTMYSIGKNGLDALTIKNYGVKEKDIVVFAFGEIDVRCHVGKQRDEKGRSLSDIIKELVVNYVSMINKNRSLYQKIYCVVMEVVPPTDMGFNVEFPIYGSLSDRVFITKQLNIALRKACFENNILYLSTHNLYALEDGTLNPELSDNIVHVNMLHNYLIKEQFINLITKVDSFNW